MAQLDLNLKPGDDANSAACRSRHEAPALREAERHLVTDWNQTTVAYPTDRCVHELVAAQAARRPGAIAAVFGSASLTYREINERANQVAHHLQGLGVGPETLVGICMERSLEMLVGLLGILKAGGAYVPLDPAYPRERLGFMWRDSGAPVLLTQQRLLERLPTADGRCRILALDADGAAMAGRSTANPISGAKADHLAYMVYTSGTTGAPKGVELTHRGLLNLISWHQRTYRVGAEDKGTHLAGVGFDASVWEIWPYLTAGATLVLADDETRLAPEKLRDWLVGNGITLSFVPTPVAEKLVALAWPEKVTLRAILTGGDRLTRAVSPGLPFALINHYGPTESTVVATCATVEVDAGDGKAPPIGRPIANTQVYLLDGEMRPVPIGAAGEIYIGGDGLARGYHGRPELTAERFVPNPFSVQPGQRLYRTGDLGRYRPTGAIEFLGRNDAQVKIRGNRIELGEIEAVLARQPEVSGAVVVAREDGAEEKRLVAYVTLRSANAGVNDLREALKQHLPDYMIPAAFVILEEFPLTPNGKIDRAALPAPLVGGGKLNGDGRETGTEIEQSVAKLVATLLGIQHVAADANFFDLGGHSLLATQLVARVRDEFGVDLPLLTVFESPKVSDLSAEIEDLLVTQLERLSAEEIGRLLDGKT